MEIVLFHARTRADIDTAEYQRAFEDMLELASGIAGFIGIEGYSGEDGAELAVVKFESAEAVAAWRNHPEHQRMQQRGRDEFYASYAITVATESRHYSWP